MSDQLWRDRHGSKVCHILVAVVGYTCPAHFWLINDQRTSRDRLGHIPDEREINGVAVSSVKALDAKIIVIEEAVVGVGFGHRGLRPSRSFQVLYTPSHAVEGHDDVGRCRLRAACPENWSVLAVVLDGPYAR